MIDICSQNGSGNQAFVFVIVGLVFQNHYLCKRIQNQSDFATRKHQYKNEIDMYIDALNNYKSSDYVHRSYPIELEKKDNADAARYASYLEIRLELKSENQLRKKWWDKWDHCDFPIVNFPFTCSNIPAALSYGVYISLCIRYSCPYCFYLNFFDKGLLLTKKLLNKLRVPSG